MRTKPGLGSGLFVILPLLAGCPLSATSVKSIIVDGRDDGSTIEAKVGDTMRIDLASDTAAGYAWNEVLDFDETILMLREQTFVDNPNSTGGAVGQLEVQVWEIRKAGTTTLTLQNRHLPGPPDTIVGTFTITVHVSP